MIPESVLVSTDKAVTDYTMDTSNKNVGFTASHRIRNPFGQYFVNHTTGGSLMALLPVRYSDVSNSQWVAFVPVTSDPLPRLEVRPSHGRGLALFTLDDIPAYSRILEDHTLLSMAQGEDLPHLWERYQALPVEDREAFDALSPPKHQTDKEAAMIIKLRARGRSKKEAAAMARISSKFQGNAFYAGMNAGLWSHGHLLFPTVARINHSCTPNAHTHYRVASSAQYAYALRDIKAGEEIEISYLDLTLPWKQRLERTQSWSFICRCPACDKRIETQYDIHLAMVAEYADYVGQEHLSRPGQIERIQRAIEIAESEHYPWLRVALPRMYINLSAALTQPGMGVSATLNSSRKAVLWQGRITGRDSPEMHFLGRALPPEDADADEAQSPSSPEERNLLIELLALLAQSIDPMIT